MEDLDVNLIQLKMTEADRNENSAKKQNIEKQLQTHGWIIKLIEDSYKKIKHIMFGKNFEKYNLHKKDKFNSNVTLRKRKLYPLTSEERLKDLPSIFTQIPTDWTKRIEAAKFFFSNIIKQVPPESYKNLKLIVMKKYKYHWNRRRWRINIMKKNSEFI